MAGSGWQAVGGRQWVAGSGWQAVVGSSTGRTSYLLHIFCMSSAYLKQLIYNVRVSQKMFRLASNNQYLSVVQCLHKGKCDLSGCRHY